MDKATKHDYGWAATIIWLDLALWYACYKGSNALDPNGMGDLFAGIFAPIAVLWIVLGYYQTSEEMKALGKETEGQKEQLKLDNAISAIEFLEKTVEGIITKLFRRNSNPSEIKSAKLSIHEFTAQIITKIEWITNQNGGLCSIKATINNSPPPRNLMSASESPQSAINMWLNPTYLSLLPTLSIMEEYISNDFPEYREAFNVKYKKLITTVRDTQEVIEEFNREHPEHALIYENSTEKSNKLLAVYSEETNEPPTQQP